MIDPFALVRQAVRTGVPTEVPPKPNGPPSAAYAAWRFLHAWQHTPEWGPDHAVLLRQLARWQQGFVGRVPDAWATNLARAGVEIAPSGDIRARPYAPSWLVDDVSQGDIDAMPKLRRPDEQQAAEPYLANLGYRSWHSAAQKEAAWAGLTAPPGSTTLIALPTGSGKSLCFQILSRFGAGLTVVVVPTVALAIDQWRSATEVLAQIPDVNPRYFAADDPSSDAGQVVEEVRSGRTRLLFTSPEACVSGRLGPALEEAARQGRFDNLVVDEAHIIENWGIYFRVDFQFLSLRQKQWHGLSGGRLRSYLLSATFTEGCRSVLQELFHVPDQPWHEFVSQRLRPEMVYYRHHFMSAEDRESAVLESLWSLPRPLILYTTEVADTDRLYDRVLDAGFRRVGRFTGETRASARKALLEAWRADRLDIMVATSAFGLGVDKGDVRAVVHACLPENLHRYYQEVGRGGRDGASSLTLLLSSVSDEHTARHLAPKLLGEELIQKRWDALWQTRQAVGSEHYVWRLSTNAKRTDLLGTRTWSENVLWNKRLILQLRRAGMLDLVGLEYTPDKEDGGAIEWITVRLHFAPSTRTLGQDLQSERTAELKAMREGLDQMLAYATGEKPICRLLSRLYGAETERVCGGCPRCRKGVRVAHYSPPLTVAAGTETCPVQRLVAGAPHPEKNARAFDRLLRAVLDQSRARRFLVDEMHHPLVLSRFNRALGAAVSTLYRVDPIPAGGGGVRLAPDESAVVFHIDSLSPRALRIRQGREIVHVITAGTAYLDVNGRFPLESEGAQLSTHPDEWLRGG
jgi:ATP-dependent DNA helicase RecQ